MPIYEYYCPDNHRIYQFFAKTISQGRTVPKCPDNPDFRMRKVISVFSVGSPSSPSDAPQSGAKEGFDAAGADPESGGPDDGRMNAAMEAMEREFSSVDENDPRAMGRMMRRMTELTGEKIDGEMEEVVRKLEEGADPEALEEQLGGDGPPASEDPKEPRPRFRTRRGPPLRDPKLYDY
jgi:hypothetical protein